MRPSPRPPAPDQHKRNSTLPTTPTDRTIRLHTHRRGPFLSRSFVPFYKASPKQTNKPKHCEKRAGWRQRRGRRRSGAGLAPFSAPPCPCASAPQTHTDRERQLVRVRETARCPRVHRHTQPPLFFIPPPTPFFRFSSRRRRRAPRFCSEACPLCRNTKINNNLTCKKNTTPRRENYIARACV